MVDGSDLWGLFIMCYLCLSAAPHFPPSGLEIWKIGMALASGSSHVLSDFVACARGDRGEDGAHFLSVWKPNIDIYEVEC